MIYCAYILRRIDLMTSIWSGNIKQLKELVKSNTLVSTFKKSSSSYYNASPQEEKAWVNSLSALIQALEPSELDSIQVIIELQMPISAERADVVLLGGTETHPKA